MSHKFDNLKGTAHGSSIMEAEVNVRSTEAHDRDDKQHQWAWLRNELSAGIEAGEAEFVALDAEDLLAKAKKRKKTDACQDLTSRHMLGKLCELD